MASKKIFLKNLIFFLISILISVLIFQSFFYYRYRTYSYYDDPIQILTDEEMFILNDKYYAYPKYYYEITGVVVGKNYQFIDYVANISPVDLSIVWGNVPLNGNLKKINFSQFSRYGSFYISNLNDVDFDIQYIQSHFSNNHIIPANSKVMNTILFIKKGDVVKIKGYLVETYRILDNGKWGTSESRYDSGDGACEVIFTTSIERF